jgi:hypothetical protein
MTKEEQLRIINDTIKKTKYNLKPLGYNLVFWVSSSNFNEFVSLLFPSNSSI